MSVGPLGGVAGSAAGSPLSQTKGSEIERSQNDSAGAERQARADEKADSAAGVGQTTEDQETSDRDADGRRIWEIGGQDQPDEQQTDEETRQGKDPTGASGTTLDLTG